MSKKKVVTRRSKEHLEVILVSVVYCLTQIPMINPTTLVEHKIFVNQSNEVNVKYGLLDSETFRNNTCLYGYYTAVLGSSVLAAIPAGNHDISLLVYSILSSLSSVLWISDNKYIEHVLVLLVGAGFGGSFVTTCTYLSALSDHKKTVRNFSLLSAVWGASCLLYMGILDVGGPCRSRECRAVSLAASLAGVVMVVALVVYNRVHRTQGRCYVPFSPDSLEFVRGTLLFKQHITVLGKVEALLVTLFYTCSLAQVAALHDNCLLLTSSYKYHLQAALPLGLGALLSSLQWAYNYKHWRSAPRTVLYTSLLVAAMAGALTLRDSACRSPELLESWYVVPVMGLLLGLSLGSVTCETFNFISIAWETRFKYTIMVTTFVTWTLGLFLVLYRRNDDVYVTIAIFTCLGALYCVSVIDFQNRSDRFSRRMENYNLADNTATVNYGAM